MKDMATQLGGACVCVCNCVCVCVCVKKKRCVAVAAQQRRLLLRARMQGRSRPYLNWVSQNGVRVLWRLGCQRRAPGRCRAQGLQLGTIAKAWRKHGDGWHGASMVMAGMAQAW